MLPSEAGRKPNLELGRRIYQGIGRKRRFLPRLKVRGWRKLTRGEEAGDLAAATLGEEHAEVIEANDGVIAEPLELRFVEDDDAVAGAGEGPENRADAEAVGAGEDAEVAGAVPDGIGLARNVVGNSFADHEAPQPGMQAVKTVADPAIDERRADSDESPRARIGILLEDLAHEDTAHAVGNDVDNVAVGAAEEILQAARVLVEPLHHGAIPELADIITERVEAFSKQAHFPSADDGTVDENHGGGGVGGRTP